MQPGSEALPELLAYSKPASPSLLPSNELQDKCHLFLLIPSPKRDPKAQDAERSTGDVGIRGVSATKAPGLCLTPKGNSPHAHTQSQMEQAKNDSS